MTFRVEICLSTMEGEYPDWVHELPKEISCLSILIIDQCCEDTTIEVENVRIIRTKERGLSKSRNCALNNSMANWVIIADNDIDYCWDGLKSLVKHLKSEKAPFVVFNEITKKCFSSNRFRELGRLRVSKVASWQIALNKSILENHRIRFDEGFGLGSPVNHGEENILLNDIIKSSKTNGVAIPLSVVSHRDLGTGAIISVTALKNKFIIFSRMYGSFLGFGRAFIFMLLLALRFFLNRSKGN